MTEKFRVAAIVLAAGLSRRAGIRNKLLAPVGGKPMVRRSTEAVLASGAAPVFVVTGHQAADVAAALDGCDVGLVFNPAFKDGMGTSIRAGIEALPDDADAVMICLADMPEIQPSTMSALIAAFDPAAERSICVPVNDGRRGNPVVFGAGHFGALADIDGDRGGRDIIDAHASGVFPVATADVGIFRDYDTI